LGIKENTPGCLMPLAVARGKGRREKGGGRVRMSHICFAEGGEVQERDWLLLI